MLDEKQCWEAIGRRDRGQDGSFFFGVVTTGVFCRPSCPARRPLRRNVRFYATSAEARRDGLRPCRRCRPLEEVLSYTADARILELCAYIEAHSEDRLDLAELAARAGLSRYHLQRSFKQLVGITPRESQEACRLRKLKPGLRHAADVTEAVYEAGYGSSSRVYERAGTRLGMTPGQYRRGGDGVEITYAAVESRAGLLLLAATDRGICSVQFGDSLEDLVATLRREYPAARIEAMCQPPSPAFRAWADGLNAHLEGAAARPQLPLDIRATAFRMEVWNYLQAIPYGQVRSYGEVAAGIGRPKAVRAVASACAANPVAVLIPCHRVIRGTGELGGYRWGVARKRVLIDLERGAGAIPARPVSAS
jgi:AraC family transcriptional regulator of adaptative response/methylated-DNA-[protein]-cysteine methyltransferase